MFAIDVGRLINVVVSIILLHLIDFVDACLLFFVT